MEINRDVYPYLAMAQWRLAFFWEGEFLIASITKLQQF